MKKPLSGLSGLWLHLRSAVVRLVYATACWGAIMSDTRRDLFKTSVLGGLGLMSASTLAACAGRTGTVGTGQQCTPTNPDAVNYSMAVGRNSANKPNCYVFHCDPNTNIYTAQSEKSYSPGAPPPVPSGSNGAMIDVLSWLTANSTKFETAPPSTVTFGGGTVTVKIGANGLVTYINPPNALSPGKATICSWNEIAP
jgi:hypothetical protein